MLHNKSPLIVLSLCALSLAASCSSNTNSPTNSNAAVATATATPTPKPTPHPAAQSALKSLRKMAGAVEMGINFQEYGSRMIDLKSEVDEQLAQLPEGELKQEIELALQAYVDAKAAWTSGAQQEFLMSEYEPVKSLMRKYKVPKAPVMGISGTQEKTVMMSAIWKVADKHIERATQLLNQ